MILTIIFTVATAAAPTTSAQDAPNSCSSTGAYGVPFGSRPDKSAKRTQGGEASVWYATAVPNPDSRFDKYLVRTDTKTKEIFQIDAVHTVIPLDKSESTTPTEREEAKNKSKQFALDFIAGLPSDVKSRLNDKYNTSHWEGIFDNTYLEISAGFAWDVTVSCRDLLREREMAHRVMPELFKK